MGQVESSPRASVSSAWQKVLDTPRQNIFAFVSILVHISTANSIQFLKKGSQEKILGVKGRISRLNRKFGNSKTSADCILCENNQESDTTVEGVEVTGLTINTNVNIEAA